MTTVSDNQPAVNSDSGDSDDNVGSLETSGNVLKSETTLPLDEQKQVDTENEGTLIRPMTYFLYPSLTWDILETFLRRNKASPACLSKAFNDLEHYLAKCYSVQDSMNEGGETIAVEEYSED